MASLVSSLSPTIKNQDTHYMIISIIIEMVTKGDLADGWWMVDDACWMMDGGLHGHLHHDDQDGDKGDLADGWWIVQMMDDGLHYHRHHREGDLADGWWGVDDG